MNPAIIGKIKGKTLLGTFTFHDNGKLVLSVNGTEFVEELGEPPDCPSGSWEIDAEDFSWKFDIAQEKLIKKARFVFGVKT